VPSAPLAPLPTGVLPSTAGTSTTPGQIQVLTASLAASLPVLRAGRVDLPDTLFTAKTGMTVAHGTDPGDFYCEHAFFLSTETAKAPGSPVLKDGAGEPMTAFLHNPADDDTYRPIADQTSTQQQRHADRSAVVGAAICGYFKMSVDQLGDTKVPFRMLITGYGSFGDVVNNPTGDFVSHQENIDAAMRSAFGAALVSGKRTGTDPLTLRYRVQTDAGERTLLISASLQGLMHKTKANAVLSMGVAGSSPTLLAEFHADDGGLGEHNGKPVHDDGRQPARNQADNYSLARALVLGGAP
jgi:hypothetical protein